MSGTTMSERSGSIELQTTNPIDVLTAARDVARKLAAPPATVSVEDALVSYREAAESAHADDRVIAARRGVAHAESEAMARHKLSVERPGFGAVVARVHVREWRPTVERLIQERVKAIQAIALDERLSAKGRVEATQAEERERDASFEPALAEIESRIDARAGERGALLGSQIEAIATDAAHEPDAELASVASVLAPISDRRLVPTVRAMVQSADPRAAAALLSAAYRLVSGEHNIALVGLVLAADEVLRTREREALLRSPARLQLVAELAALRALLEEIGRERKLARQAFRKAQAPIWLGGAGLAEVMRDSGAEA